MIQIHVCTTTLIMVLLLSIKTVHGQDDRPAIKKQRTQFSFSDKDVAAHLQKYPIPFLDQPSILSGFNLEQARQKMSSISHILCGDALISPQNSIDTNDLEIENLLVKRIVVGVRDQRIKLASPPEDVVDASKHDLQANMNNQNLKLLFFKPLIEKELREKDIFKFVQSETQAFHKEIDPEFQKKRTAFAICEQDASKSIVLQSKKPASLLHEIVKSSYGSFYYENGTSLDDESRKLFNDIFVLERAIICDDSLQQQETALKYQELVSQYDKLVSQLSPRAQAYIQGSFVSIQKSLDQFPY